ncbi:N-acetylmuramoyl-L-alanine amidase [Lichenifustis flavocetrariae]|uniref:N-acetylmuramoyl-L-alanine amidase n=1 Tax=Lichenifustis flavocetrariae TaxID=2949735 RepID=A0AA41Z4V2_9HYPH|nr:N-acetylmuramoyl-L-alanine amidase [Lichenifustis flavocetrariae]MCW6510330.1 N-acetylmuramoyl-L-alanine amidase [Lichenifustis flavocetrariae]
MSERFTSTLASIERSYASPNHGERLGNLAWPDTIVLHYTGMKDGPSAVDWLCNPASQVSSHYVVTEGGAILQLVPEERRAWHAGRSVWAGVSDLNSASIGIEIVNGGHDHDLPAFPDRQIEAVIALCRDTAARHAVPPERVLAHSDIAPGRKRDPGERFPWARLAVAGVGHWPENPSRAEAAAELGPGAVGDAVVELQAALAQYGYGVQPTGVYDTQTETVVRAFQLHFRADQVDGIADGGTRGCLTALLSALPNASVSLQPARKA